MFSGIVAEMGRVTANRIATAGRLDVARSRPGSVPAIGASIAVNGCCLTVVEADAASFAADVMPQTARLTTLGQLEAGSGVNLEPALRFGDEVGGHMVSGHIDAVGTVTATVSEGNARRVTIAAPADVMVYVVERGSIAVDGISLTVAARSGDTFSVSLIPHTLEVTTAGGWASGSRVNLEADLLARYVVAARERMGVSA